jgi:hypothetical protein
MYGGYTADIHFRNEIEPLFTRHGVDLVVSNGFMFGRSHAIANGIARNPGNVTSFSNAQTIHITAGTGGTYCQEFQDLFQNTTSIWAGQNIRNLEFNSSSN